MKTWHISVEDGPHQSYDLEIEAPTKDKAIAKALKQELKKFPYKHIEISPGACWQIKEKKMDKTQALKQALGLPEDEPGVVNVLSYRGTIYGVYHHYDDAYAAAIEQFGEGAFTFLDANIRRIRVQ